MDGGGRHRTEETTHNPVAERLHHDGGKHKRPVEQVFKRVQANEQACAPGCQQNGRRVRGPAQPVHEVTGRGAGERRPRHVKVPQATERQNGNNERCHVPRILIGFIGARRRAVIDETEPTQYQRNATVAQDESTGYSGCGGGDTERYSP